MSNLIGITGVAGAGKDTVASIIKEFCPDTLQHSFAVPIYLMLDAAFPPPKPFVSWREVDRNTKDNHVLSCGRTFRYLAQTLGTDWGRNLVERDVWVKAAIEQVHPDSRAVFSDVRFGNEAMAIAQASGIMLKVVRPNNPHQIGTSHASEQEVEGLLYHRTIYNAGTLEKLRANVLEALTFYGWLPE